MLNDSQDTFSTEVVMEYLDRFIVKENGRFHMDTRLNGILLEKRDVRRIYAWTKGETQTVSIWTLDRLLSDYRMHIRDFEIWLSEREIEKC